MLRSEGSKGDSSIVKPGLNWKQGGIAFGLGLLVLGFGQLYCRRWRVAISYQLTLLRPATFRSPSDGAAALVVISALQLFILGQALWFGLRTPQGAPLPKLSAVVWTTAGLMTIVTAIGATGGVYMSRLVGLKVYTISARSMAPTINQKNKILVDLRAYRNSPPSRGDVVAFKKDGEVFVKRVVALEGDSVEYSDERLVVNSKAQVEAYLVAGETSVDTDRDLPKHAVAAHAVYVLGDNRPNSNDSRYFGDIPESAIIGKVIDIYWPIHDARKVQ
jgi:signal peptidase I